MNDSKEEYLIVLANYNIFATLLLGNTLRALMTSFRSPWQHSRSTKRPSKFQKWNDGAIIIKNTYGIPNA